MSQLNNEMLWYPLRVTYSQEMKVKQYLESIDIECFIPMQYESGVEAGHKYRKLVPVIHNLIFVHTTKANMTVTKRDTPIATLVRYIMNKETRTPLLVPEQQMKDFIAVAGRPEEDIIWLPNETNYTKGERVRIIDGIWKGVTGTLKSIKNSIHVVVSIDGFMSVATASLHPSQVERIED
jgi:transcription antitermination factor NusG